MPVLQASFPFLCHVAQPLTSRTVDSFFWYDTMEQVIRI